MDDHLDLAVMEAGLDEIRGAPSDNGIVELIVIRPAIDQREILTVATADPAHGIVGDIWSTKASVSTADGRPHPNKQITIMNARTARVVAGESKDRWALAGDQLYVDLDLSGENLPAGTRLAVGEAVLEVAPEQHRGCKKFGSRFGLASLRFLNSDVGKVLNLRGVNTWVVQGGTIKRGDTVTKI